MKDISQTKEGFIKSMILFVVLLGICFAPFFAFSNPIESPISVDLNIKNKHVECKIATLFTCTSYSIEVKNLGETEYKTVFSCNDAMCQDATQSIAYSFDLVEYPYSEYRIKAIDQNGQAHIQTGSFNKVAGVNPIELLNSAVNETLFLTTNGFALITDFTYTISDFNGNLLTEPKGLNGNSIDLAGLSQGFYIISLKNLNGEEFHFKFLRQ